jgi:hypothetical protein
MIEGTATGNVLMKNNYRVFVKEGAANLSQFEKNSNGKQRKSSFMAPIPAVSGFDYTTVSTQESAHIRLNALIDDHG